MPLYDFRCERDHRFERFVGLAQFDAAQTCDCGAPSSRMVAGPRIKSDVIAPCLGPDGRMHDSLSSYRHACRPEGNPQGERYHELGDADLDPVTYKFDRKQRRDDISHAVADVKNGWVPPPSVALEDF